MVPPPGTEPKMFSLTNKMALGIVMKLQDLGSKYEGQLDGKGNRHGKGKATYIDGSTYEGDWVEGRRHGNGE